MPLVRLSIPDHLPVEKATALADAVHHSLVEACAVPPEDRFQLISRFPPSSMMIDPHFVGMNRTPDACIIEILFLTTRTDDQKRALYRLIASKAVDATFTPDDIMVTLVENERIDWSLGQGLAFVDQHH